MEYLFNARIAVKTNNGNYKKITLKGLQSSNISKRGREQQKIYKL